MREEGKIKVLNLYAGIGGNRKLWENVDVTAVENNPEIAKIYSNFFPNDKVIVTDAHQYLLDHFKEFDFIWSSPPCPTHSRIRFIGVKSGDYKPLYPDMRLYQEVLLLQNFFKGKWVIENVITYYEPLIKPKKIQRHYFWANFIISDIRIENDGIGKHKTELNHFTELETLKKKLGFDISKYDNIPDKRGLLRNCVNPKLALHIFNMAFNDKQKSLVSI